MQFGADSVASPDPIITAQIVNRSLITAEPSSSSEHCCSIG